MPRASVNRLRLTPPLPRSVGLGPVSFPAQRRFVQRAVEDAPQKLGRDNAFGARVEFGKRHFTGAVNGHEEILRALRGLHFRKIDVQVADGIVFEFLFRRPLPVFAQRQAADAGAVWLVGGDGVAGGNGVDGVFTNYQLLADDADGHLACG